MAFDYTKILLNIPGYQVDNIVGTHSGTFTVSAPHSGSPDFGITYNTDSFDTGFGDSCLFQGIFSVDSGSTWNDFGSTLPDLTTAGSPVLQTATCTGYVTSGGVFTASGINWYDFVHSSGTAKTILYKVVFLAKDDQAELTPLMTTEILQYNSTNNYQKIFQSSTFASGSSNTTITHSLGYVPKVRGWFKPTSDIFPSDGNTVPAGAICTLDNLKYGTNVFVNSTQAIFTPANTGSASFPNVVNGTMYYRIYVDG